MVNLSQYFKEKKNAHAIDLSSFEIKDEDAIHLRTYLKENPYLHTLDMSSTLIIFIFLISISNFRIQTILKGNGGHPRGTRGSPKHIETGFQLVVPRIWKCFFGIFRRPSKKELKHSNRITLTNKFIVLSLIRSENIHHVCNILAMNHPSLKGLDLSYNAFSNEDGLMMLESLKHNFILELLLLKGNTLLAETKSKIEVHN